MQYIVAYHLLRTKRHVPIVSKLNFTYRIKTYGTHILGYTCIKLNIFLIIDDTHILI